MNSLKYIALMALVILSFSVGAQKKFSGTFSNGFKGAKLSFTLSADGKRIQNFVFDGYWRCGGVTEHITAGPDRSFPVANGKIEGTVLDPANGGTSAFRFSLDGIIKAKQASGTFRMSIAGLSCDTYKLEWTATSN